MVLLLAIACSRAPAVDTGERPDRPTEHVYVPEDGGIPIDPAVLEAELQQVVDELRRFHGQPALDAWTAARSLGEEGCPPETVTTTEDNGVTTYFDGLCITSDDIWFKGPQNTWTVADNPLDQFELQDFRQQLSPDGTRWTGFFIRGQVDVYNADASVDYNCSCTAGVAEAEDETGKQSWFSYVDGPTHWTGPEVDGTWVDEGVQAQLFLRFGRDPVEDLFTAEVRGTVTGRTEVYNSMELALEMANDLRTPERCTGRSGGYIEVRHATTGHRQEMLFQVTDPETCRACTTVEEGEICVDLGPLQQWEGDAPWL